jgi:hypothetical protein
MKPARDGVIRLGRIQRSDEEHRLALLEAKRDRLLAQQREVSVELMHIEDSIAEARRLISQSRR